MCMSFLVNELFDRVNELFHAMLENTMNTKLSSSFVQWSWEKKSSELAYPLYLPPVHQSMDNKAKMIQLIGERKSVEMVDRAKLLASSTKESSTFIVSNRESSYTFK